VLDYDPDSNNNILQVTASDDDIKRLGPE
jgi:hypothetical protein